MADNVQLNPGQGGSVMRTFQDAGGRHWSPALQAFAISATDGANVLQVVDAAHGLPVQITGDGLNVAQADETLLNATVYQGGAWVTQLAPGQTVGVSGTVTVTQSEPVSISGTVPVSIAAPVAAVQSGSWITGLAPGTEVKLASGSATAITGTVTVAQSGPVTISGTVPVSIGSAVSLAPGTEVKISDPVAISGTVPVSIGSTVTVAQSNAANLKMTATLASGSTVALGAGTALAGKFSAGADGSTIYNGTTALTPVSVAINAAALGNNPIVAAVAGKKIKVIQWNFTAHGEVNAEWRSGSTTVISGPRPLIKYASAGGSPSPWGRFETAAGEALNLNLSAAVRVGGELSYVLV